ncbi:Putative TrmH family tRNA/rRNA methyltransferase [Actinomyces bovis]|uniref:TrmH family tRNA/rRNA methyltransferase n=1 Tax=Actinomyces bovis TaxID=1658 RepID=A0ABY1VPH9_9ACTO|nr:RNA methyltransferase [Actinomyces bovis]SPT53965.1 Putative TrmH family tRNA/rRNA methyltransferase [Actinomyces bovis]VEG53499.1 Putative TrmH family tRNA/rRNA methyltransferase [Actinomyces israelii]
MTLTPTDLDAMLTNPGSERVSRVAGLTRRQLRSKYGRFLIEGPQAVREAVRHAAEAVRDLYLTPVAAERYPEIWQEAGERGLYRHLVSAEVMAAMSADAQGVLAVADLPRLRGPQVLAEVLKHASLVAVLTEAQDPGNAGTIIRAGDAAGADVVVVIKGSVEVTSPKVVRSTAGSLFHLPVVTGVTLEETTAALRAAGLMILAADGRGSVQLFDAEAMLAGPVAWLLGNEAHGLSAQAVAAADAVVAIPIYGKAESLNVAAAATVCLYATARAQH